MITNRVFLGHMILISIAFSFASFSEGPEERQTVRQVKPNEDLTERQDFSGLLGYEPYEPNLWKVIKRDDKSLGFLAQAIEAAGLSTLLKEDQRYTVFAPTNEAFAKLTSAMINAMRDPLNRDKLAEIIKNHILPVKLLPEDISKANVVKNLNGKELAIKVEGDTISVNDAKLIGKGTNGANGILYTIDTVLMP